MAEDWESAPIVVPNPNRPGPRSDIKRPPAPAEEWESAPIIKPAEKTGVSKFWEDVKQGNYPTIYNPNRQLFGNAQGNPEEEWNKLPFSQQVLTGSNAPIRGLDQEKVQEGAGEAPWVTAAGAASVLPISRVIAATYPYLTAAGVTWLSSQAAGLGAPDWLTKTLENIGLAKAFKGAEPKPPPPPPKYQMPPMSGPPPGPTPPPRPTGAPGGAAATPGSPAPAPGAPPGAGGPQFTTPPQSAQPSPMRPQPQPQFTPPPQSPQPAPMRPQPQPARPAQPTPQGPFINPGQPQPAPIRPAPNVPFPGEVRPTPAPPNTPYTPNFNERFRGGAEAPPPPPARGFAGLTWPGTPSGAPPSINPAPNAPWPPEDRRPIPNGLPGAGTTPFGYGNPARTPPPATSADIQQAMLRALGRPPTEGGGGNGGRGGAGGATAQPAATNPSIRQRTPEEQEAWERIRDQMRRLGGTPEAGE